MCRFICCCCCCLYLIVLTLSVVSLYFYTIYKPQAPSYTVENLEVKTFESNPDDLSLKTEFLVTVRADNPNGNIGFIYGEDSSVNVVHSDTELCSGKLPHFHQPPMNVTEMKIGLAGRSKFGPDLQEAYEESRKNGQIPLLVKVKVPVKVVVGDFQLRELKVLVNCSMVVDNLAAGKEINVIGRNTTFAVEL